jgi:RHS repeat-associated protein
MTYPSGRAVDFSRDSVGRVSNVSTTFAAVTKQVLQNLTYDPFGPVIGFTYGNGLARAVGFDLDGRVTAIQSALAQELDYGYDLFDQIANLDDNITIGRNQSFDYDGLDRLVIADGDYGTFLFSYDGVGNRINLDGSGGLDTYGYATSSHHLESITGPNAETRTYDAAGNTETLKDLTLTYGDHSRLTEVWQGGSKLADYSYDGLGRRIIKTTGGKTSIYHYDQEGNLIAETDGQGHAQNEFIYVEGQPLAARVYPPPAVSQCSGGDLVLVGETVSANQTYYCQATSSITAGDEGFAVEAAGAAVLSAPRVVLRQGFSISAGGALTVGPAAAVPQPIGTLYFIHPDHLGTPRLMTDAAQAVVWRWDSAPFAEGAPNEDPDGDGQELTLNLRFRGQYFDQETGLHYNYFRDYDPTTGRYIESDPSGLDGGLNTYLYVYASPLHLIDPMGLTSWYCKRPLGGKPGSKGQHHYICVTLPNGKIKCDSTSPGFNYPTWPWAPEPGIPSDPNKDYYDSTSCEWVERDNDDCVEKCLLDRWNRPRPLYTVVGPFGTNCQEYSTGIKLDCMMECFRKKNP